jgi:ribosome-associated heat shock protein Hsp15
MAESTTDQVNGPEAVRLDKWLWTARFFKTRQIAVEAINAGRVEVNGERAKPAKTLRVNDVLLVRKPPYEFHLDVTGLAEKRVSAVRARALYTETEVSVAARLVLSQELRDLPPPVFKGRPTKQDRRALEKFLQTPFGMGDDES